MSESSLIKMFRKPFASPSKHISVTAASGLQVLASSSLDLGTNMLNPFSVADDVISQNIIGIHDSQAVRHDVGSLYNLVTKIVQSSTHIAGSLDLKRGKSIELVEDKVDEAGFMPSYSTLKEIACQMTCKSFNTGNAHDSVVGILEKLRSYTWDAKAVIALTAFALDYGETWRLSLMKPNNKENALELHVFRFGEEEKPSQTSVDLISTLVDRTLQLIDGIIQLEKWIADKTFSPKDVPALYKAPRDLYTYWAILALLASATQMTDLDWNIKFEVVGRLKIVLTQLNADLDKIKAQIEVIGDLTWRLRVFQTPSGILELLKALIIPQDYKKFDIIFDHTKLEVNLEVLKKKNLLLFISGLDHIENEIWALKPIHESLTKDNDKQDYKILWVPVVEKWDIEAKEKFEKLKSQMPWYVVQYFSPIAGIKPLQQEWEYQGKPIVVVANARGEVIKKNAMHMIFVWGISAFPFGSEAEDIVSQHGKWFWNEAFKIFPDIERWVSQENGYTFIYGGTEITWTQRFSNLVEAIKKDPIIKQADVYIEQFNITKLDITLQTKFWLNIANSFLSKIQKSDDLNATLKDIQTLLSMRTEKGWAILSKGEKVFAIGYNDVMMSVVEGFETWRSSVLELQGFDIAFNTYYDRIVESVPAPCVHFRLDNIRSGIPTTITCSNPKCDMKMEIESVNYKCFHGQHYEHAVNANGEVNTPVIRTKFSTP